MFFLCVLGALCGERFFPLQNFSETFSLLGMTLIKIQAFINDLERFLWAMDSGERFCEPRVPT